MIPAFPFSSSRSHAPALGVMVLLTILSPAVPVRAVEAQSPEQLRRELRALILEARDRVFPALVNIDVVTVNYWRGQERKGRATGSGTIISPEGYVITNEHVTHNGSRFTCTLANKKEITADLIGEDPLTDLAVLKLNLDELDDTDKPLPYAEFGDSGKLEVGDTVMAMGSPFSLSRSVTLGIVSNAERVFGGSGGEIEEMELDAGQRSGLFTNWIQHDATINPGNSGGPLVNLEGKIVGVNELGRSGSNMGFAIPSNLAKHVSRDIIEHGEVPRSDVGMMVRSIKDTGLEHGALVNSVRKDGPADKAGIQPGDVVLKINDRPVDVRFTEQIPPLLREFASMPIGSAIQIEFTRDDQNHTTTLITEKLQEDVGDKTVLRAWGLTVWEITPRMARERRLENTEGVLVAGVRPGASAALAEPSLRFGDVIHAVNGQPITDLAQLVALYGSLTDSDSAPEYVMVEFDRQGKDHLTMVKTKPDKPDDPPRELKKAWIGVATQPVVERLAERLGGKTLDARGFRITRVYPDTLAAGADLKAGDIILALNGQRLVPQGMQDVGLFERRVRKLDIGADAKLTLLRDGQTRDISITLDKTRVEPSEARSDNNRDFELTVRELTFFDRDDNRWDRSVRGVIVTQVEPAGWSGLAGLRPGDLIQSINHHDITGLSTYRKVMERIADEKPRRVVLLVLRGVHTRFIFVEPEWKPQVKDTPDE